MKYLYLAACFICLALAGYAISATNWLLIPALLAALGFAGLALGK